MDNKLIDPEVIRKNYLRVVERIGIAAHKAGRDPSEIRLVVVTKTHPIEMIEAVIEAGATDLGENYVEEAIPKIQALAGKQPIRWHMIGHIQSRKSQEVVEYFQYVHSLDSLKLAERLSRFSLEIGKVLPIWMEFNIGGEQTKSGWDITHRDRWVDLLPDLGRIISLPGLIFLGAMTVPPYSTNPEDSRPYYQKLKEFLAFVNGHFNLAGFNELSIGMSSDFEVAIQEGATCLRIGQAVLGPRN